MRLRVLDAAEEDVSNAFDYYESQSEGLGHRMSWEVREALTRILRFPEAHPAVDSIHRKRSLKKFPYAVFFRIDHEEVIMVACFDLRSDPSKWRDRLKIR